LTVDAIEAWLPVLLSSGMHSVCLYCTRDLDPATRWIQRWIFFVSLPLSLRHLPPSPGTPTSELTTGHHTHATQSDSSALPQSSVPRSAYCCCYDASTRASNPEPFPGTRRVARPCIDTRPDPSTIYLVARHSNWPWKSSRRAAAPCLAVYKITRSRSGYMGEPKALRKYSPCSGPSCPLRRPIPSVQLPGPHTSLFSSHLVGGDHLFS
jgi:hypothetical protein